MFGPDTSKKVKPGGPFTFRVSDAVAVPLRGYLLRLRLLEGSPDINTVKPGKSLRLVSPGGTERIARVVDFSTTGGRQTQERLNAYRELDVVISAEDALGDDGTVEIGWLATGPVGDRDDSG